MFTAASVALLLGYCMLVWLQTNAFVEYMTLLGMDRLFKIREYHTLQRDGYGGNYIEFLLEYYRSNFFVRLLACPVCVSFWLGLIATLVARDIAATLVAPLALLFYLIFNKLL
jgi:hypothetical protein